MSHIQDVQAEIRQTIRQQGVDEKRRGYYWADNRGRFRLQFFEPDELVVFDGEKLYWYIASNGFSWVMAPNDSVRPQTLTQPVWFSRDFFVEYKEPLTSRFWSSDKVSFKVRNPTMVVALRYSRSIRAIIHRELYDMAGNRLLSENFDDPVDCAGKPFFRRVSVVAGHGKWQVSNETEYYHPLCNRGLPNSLFLPPPGPQKIYHQ